MPTPGIFDFDADGLDSYDDARVAEALERHPAVYVNHLRIAQHIEATADGLEAQRANAAANAAAYAAATGATQADDDNRYGEGYVAALRGIVTALRQADYVPSGPMLNEDDLKTGRFKAR